MKSSAKLFKALADETRLRILALLLAKGELCVCHIMTSLQLPQSTASRHLAYLKNSGIVDDRRVGLWVYYSIQKKDEFLFAGLIDLLNVHLPPLPAAEADAQRLALSLAEKSCL